MKGSIPEPAPVAKGIVVPDLLIYFIDGSKMLSAPAKEALVNLVRQRAAFGEAKYGQPLFSEDGRDGAEDARQELGDLMQYLFKCKIAGVEPKEVIQMMRNFLLCWDE